MVAEYVMDTCIEIPNDKNKQNKSNENVRINFETRNTTESFVENLTIKGIYDYKYMQDDKGHNCCKKCV